MKVKKNKKMRFSSKSRYFLTLAVLAGFVGNPLLQGTTVLAESFSPDTSLVTGDETQLPDVLNPEIPEVLEDQSERQAIQTDEEKTNDFDAIENTSPVSSEVRTEEIALETEKGDSELSSTEVVPTQAMTVWGNVSAEWDSDTRTLTLIEGSITNSDFFAQTADNQRLRNAIEHIVFEAEITVGGNRSLNRLFLQMRNLTSIENFEHLNTEGVTNMAQMFASTGLTRVDLSSLDTSAVTTMEHMFSGAISLLSLDVSGFVTDNVTNMEDMFSYTHNLSEIKGLNAFNTSAVTTMYGMFWHAEALTSLDLSAFDTSVVEDMSWMFANTHALTELDISSFNTAAVTDMQAMFLRAANLTDLDLSFFDTGAVRDMSMMFADTHRLSSLDISSFVTSSVTTMFAMFTRASALIKLDLSSFNTRAVTDMNQMFLGASMLTELDLSSFETPALTQAAIMFQNASALRKLDLSSFDTRNVAPNNRNNFLAGLNALVELRLGENTNIGNSALPDETTTPGFLNSWKRETQRGPADWLSSQDLMTLSGTAGEATGTWRRVPYQTNVQVKDSSIFIGEDWQPEDNFVSATDSYGETVSFDRITVEGTVDTDTAGTYKVTYSYDGVSATAEITVKESQTSVNVKNSALFVGENWTAQDNFVSATDRYGETVPFNRITVEGTVDTDTAGTYKVTYTYDGVEATAEITVKESQTSVQVKDSSLFVGEAWTAQDNFVSATDRYGEIVPFDRITVEETVDTDTAGTYKVTYTYDGVEATAEITVKARGGNGNGATNGGESNNGGTESNNGDGTNGNGTSGEDDDRKEEPNHSDNKEDEHKQTSTDNLPRTGEIGGLFGALGLANLMHALTLWLKRRKLK
ncbi:bacterial Ig-like domain-containing protein [Lactococcus petauri]|uniref:bacterial Ig-like domain-containing protein n=1 Tax=Lactococcus petauri TaxID=1940789 RepID=UPI002891C9C4|nr:bacterial Ig-like domain-containing protein [Lactococcus petauri]MDT2551688.1 bacterial Ig-like domain-containing protein [Lactococcus petauri]MDT2581132.1 bacterial Ig-like domain-containing protein [Lactococcus petauri]